MAPPKSRPETTPTFAGTSPVSSSVYSVPHPLSQPSGGLPRTSTKPEIGSLGSVVSPSTGLGFPSVVSLTVSATLSLSSSLSFPGYSIVPSPSGIAGGGSPSLNASSTIIPVFTPSLLGNGYGGGFVSTPSVYVTKLSFPYGPSDGVPPGYGFSSKTETLASNSSSSQPLSTFLGNATSTLPGLGVPTTTAVGPTNLTAIAGSPIGSPISSTASSGVVGFNATIPANGIQTPTDSISLPTTEASTITASSASASDSPFEAGTGVILPSSSNVTPSQSFPPASIPGSTLTPILITNSITSGEITVGISTPSPVLVSSVASSGQVIVETSNPTLLPGGPSATDSVGVPLAPVFTPGIFTASNGQPIVETPPSVAGTSFSISQVNIGLSTPSGVLITSTGSNGGVTVVTSVPSPSAPQASEVSAIVTSYSASSGEIIVATSTPAPVLVSNTATTNGVTVETQAPGSSSTSPVFVSPTVVPGGTPIELGVIGSPVSSPGEIAGAPITVAAASISEQSSASGQLALTILTPVVGANGLTSLAVVPSSAEQGSPAGQPAPTVLTPVTGANGLTSLAVVPSPVVGANGLTSLAVFSTPIAAANGLVSPAVILTPVVGVNGQTSLAVLATPVIGVNGQTSLAIGLEGQQGPSGTPSPIEEFIPDSSAEASLGAQSETSTSSIVPQLGASGTASPSASMHPTSGSGDNSTVHISLNPSATSQFEGSGLKLTWTFGMCLWSFVVILILL